MRVIDPKQAAWLKEDRVWKWKRGRWQCRFEQWFCRLAIIPGMGIDWECGMTSVIFYWLPWCICFDFEYDTEYDAAEHEIEYPVYRD